MRPSMGAHLITPFLTFAAPRAEPQGLPAQAEYRGATLKGEYIGQHRDRGMLDDKGWYAQGNGKVLPWVQLVLKHEDFRRSEVSDALRNRATTGGVNVEFADGKVRLLADYVSPEGRNTGDAEGHADHPGAGRILGLISQRISPPLPILSYISLQAGA